MGILDCARRESVYRGYEYYKNEKVITCTQLSEYEYEGEVKGKNINPYHVLINTIHPKKSSCTCPFANGNTICKHMVALFFAVSPEDFKDYEEWLENDYEEENDEDYYEDDEYEDNDYYDYYDDYNDEYNRYESYNKNNSTFVKPVFFNEILLNFINNLSKEEAKEILYDELISNEQYTFNKYLKKEFKKYCQNKDNINATLENINNKFYRLTHNYYYNDKDYSQRLLTRSEKKKIEDVYTNDIQMKAIIDKIILNPGLTLYYDYVWIANLYRNNNSKKDVQAYGKKLESFFSSLKHYSVKNNVPKSNVLIIIYTLSDYSIEETVQLMIKNCKYEEYIDYIIKNYDNVNDLYKEFNKCVEKEKYINKEYIAKAYYSFYLVLSNGEAYDKYLYYSFLFSKNTQYLSILKDSSRFNYYLDKIINNTNDVVILENVYLFLNKKEELLKLLLSRENDYRLIENINILKEQYNNEIFTYLKSRFYDIINTEKSRECYSRACYYIKCMKELDNGEKLIDDLINELKSSEYSKRKVLFDEIFNAVKR